VRNPSSLSLTTISSKAKTVLLTSYSFNLSSNKSCFWMAKEVKIFLLKMYSI
jgi:hypothetical protein